VGGIKRVSYSFLIGMSQRERGDDDGNEQMVTETEVKGTGSLRHVEDRPTDSESLRLALVQEREKIREEKEKAQSAWEIERQRS